jgi:hypothetical protein
VGHKMIEIKPGTGVVFSPLYLKKTTELIHDAQISDVKEAVPVLIDDLTEVIINETESDIRNFDFSTQVVARRGSGYLHLRFEKTSPLAAFSGTYLFPTVEAMAHFSRLVEDLQDCLRQSIERKKWEQVTVFRKLA